MTKPPKKSSRPPTSASNYPLEIALAKLMEDARASGLTIEEHVPSKSGRLTVNFVAGRATSRTPAAPRLWYRRHPANGGLVFARPDNPTKINQIHEALGAKTWGEFFQILPEDESEDLRQRLFENEDDERGLSYDDNNSFDADSIPGFSEGDYPRWLQSEMDYVIPKEVLHRFGSTKSTFGNGNYIHLEPSDAEEVVQALTGLGYVVERRDDLKFW